MRRTPNEFGLYPWFPEHGYGYVHPAYRRDFESLEPNDKVFEKLEESDEWLMIRYQDEQFKVKPELYTPILPLPFTFGDQVHLHNPASNSPTLSGEITDIFWNPKEDRPFFLIRQGRKKLEYPFRTEELRKG